MKANKNLATVMAATMVISGTVIPASASTTEDKIVGSNRTDTAVKISKEGWYSADTVILVNDAAIPDALTATPLAHAKKAPILLTGKGGLTKATADEIKRLGAKDVIMIGGDAVLPAKIEKDLKALNVKADRVKGATREETALAIAKRLDGIKDVSEIAVVNSTTGLADAVSVAAAAAEKGMPIILANPKKGLSAAEKFIKGEAIKASFVIGGKTALPEKLVSNLPSRQRIEGSNRNDTNAKVIEKFYGDKELDNIYVAKDGRGGDSQLIDALAVGALAAKNGAPVLIASKKLSETQVNVINTKKIDTITQVGGKGNEGAFSHLKDIEKAEVIKVKTESELQEALKKANANDTIEIDANATISKDLTLSTNNAIQINVKGDLTGKVTVKTPNADIKNSGTIGTLVVENGKNTTVTNTSAGKIDKVEVSSSSSNVKVENNGKIEKVENNASGTSIENNGTISKPIEGTNKPSVEGNKPGETTKPETGGGSSAPTYTTGATVNGTYYDTVAKAVTAAEAGAGDTVKVYGTNKLSSQLVINEKINLVGADSNALIESTEDYKIYIEEKDKPKNNLITVQADGVKISNLSVRHNKKLGFGIHVYGVKDVNLSNVTATDCGKGGLLVNSSTVTADRLTTSGNGWYGVDVDERIENTTKAGKLPATFTLTNSDESISEPVQVYAEKGTVNWGGSHKYLEKAKEKNKENYYDKGYIYSKRTEEKFTKGAVVKLASKDNTQLVGDYYEDVKKAIEVGSGKTVEIYGEYTIPANTTVDVKGTVTGTIKGTDNTSELIVGDNGTYEKLAKGTYVWVKDSWVKKGTNIIENGGLTNDNGQLKASFIWSSSEDIGTGTAIETENGLGYYKDGVYLRLQVKKDNNVVAFDKVFKSAKDDSKGKHNVNSKECGLLLKTKKIKGNQDIGEKYNDLDGSIREKADWTAIGGYGEKGYKGTDLDNNKEKKYIFYGVRQGKGLINKEDVNLYKSRTVGFKAGDVRKIELVLNPLTNLGAGEYTVTIQLMEQKDSSPTTITDTSIGKAINYSFTVNEGGTITVNN